MIKLCCVSPCFTQTLPYQTYCLIDLDAKVGSVCMVFTDCFIIGKLISPFCTILAEVLSNFYDRCMMHHTSLLYKSIILHATINRSRCHGNVRLNDVSKRRTHPGVVSRRSLFDARRSRLCSKCRFRAWAWHARRSRYALHTDLEHGCGTHGIRAML